jgi:hypothetical protein
MRLGAEFVALRGKRRYQFETIFAGKTLICCGAT